VTVVARAARRLTAIAALALVLASCGPTPPQAPLKEAKKLSVSTSGISTACGLAFLVTAFPGNHNKELETIEATAASSAQKLASVYARNQSWIYQGETVREVVRDALAMLDSCGLSKAQSLLAHATYEHPSHR
jgi:hypothetical protein